MTALEFIKRKQKDWAEGKDFTLLPGTIGSETGNKIYFDDYNKNLYAKLSEDNKNDYNKGSGGEIRDTTTRRAPMKATFSSHPSLTMRVLRTPSSMQHSLQNPLWISEARIWVLQSQTSSARRRATRLQATTHI